VNAHGSRAPVAPGPLVLDGQKSATPARGWCERGPKGLRIATGDGFYRPPCKRRDCARCWARRSRELARCLVLDARDDPPTTCLTLTTRHAWEDLDPEFYRRGSENVFRRLRRLYGPVEYFGAIEFTTGKAERSGGRRRLHGHYLVKGLAEQDVIDVERVVRETWERSIGAWRVEVARLVSPGAALGYLALHHRKPEQSPPAAWRGMTERSSKGYWSRPIADLRQQAQAELAAESLAWAKGLSVEEAAIAIALRDEPRLIEVRSLNGSAVVEPLGEFPTRYPKETQAAVVAARAFGRSRPL